MLQHIIGHDLGENDLRKLHTRIEGWAAGLQMTGLSMRGKEDLTRFVRDFTGSHRFIMDYLIEEVFSGQHQSIQTFLLQTSVLKRLNPALCRHVTDIEDAEGLLYQLERSNLFVIPLDDQHNWYRYHHLFAELLGKRLLQTDPQSISQLNQKAGEWYAAQGLSTESIDYFIKAENYSAVEEQIGLCADELWWRGEHGLIHQWLEQLPDSYRITSPYLSAVLALIVFFDGRFNEAGKYLHIAERHTPSDQKNSPAAGITALIRAYLANYQGKRAEAIANGKLALSILTDVHAVWRCLASITIGDVHVQNGPLKPAIQAYKEAIRSGTIANNHYAFPWHNTVWSLCTSVADDLNRPSGL